MPLPKAPPIGRMRNLATLLAWKDTPGPRQGIEPTYVPIGQLWCSIEASQGSQLWNSGAQTFEADGAARGTHVARLRYRQDVTHECILETKRMKYRILAVAEDDARRFLTVYLEEYGKTDVIGERPPFERSPWDYGNSTWDNDQTIWEDAIALPFKTEIE